MTSYGMLRQSGRSIVERIEVGGISLEAWIGGDGPPLLFLHGGDYVLQNRPFLDRLAQRFRVVAPRHPGFGSSPRPAWFRTIHDIAYLYLDLIDRLALDRPLVVGSSLGGSVALEMAGRDPGEVGPVRQSEDGGGRVPT